MEAMRRDFPDKIGRYDPEKHAGMTLYKVRAEFPHDFGRAFEAGPTRSER